MTPKPEDYVTKIGYPEPPVELQILRSPRPAPQTERSAA
jgi:hypothetical protein